MKQTKHLNKALLSIITTLGLGGAITGSAILASTTTNVDKLELLTHAVQDNTVERLQSKRGDIQISLGTYHSAAVINGSLYTWGLNVYGQLGLGDKYDRNIPTRVTQLPSGPITQIALGSWHSAAVINGLLYTWGYNDSGQLGLGYFGGIQTIPTQVTSASNGAIVPGTVTQIALGFAHSAAVINGALYTWGNNGYGQLGLGDETRRIIPTQVIRTFDGGANIASIQKIVLGYDLCSSD